MAPPRTPDRPRAFPGRQLARAFITMPRAQQQQQPHRARRRLGEQPPSVIRAPLRTAKVQATRPALDSLIAEENRLETNRTSGEATYSIQRHVAVLTALIAEARLLPAGQAA